MQEKNTLAIAETLLGIKLQAGDELLSSLEKVNSYAENIDASVWEAYYQANLSSKETGFKPVDDIRKDKFFLAYAAQEAFLLGKITEDEFHLISNKVLGHNGINITISGIALKREDSKYGATGGLRDSVSKAEYLTIQFAMKELERRIGDKELSLNLKTLSPDKIEEDAELKELKAKYAKLENILISAHNIEFNRDSEGYNFVAEDSKVDATTLAIKHVQKHAVQFIELIKRQETSMLGHHFSKMLGGNSFSFNGEEVNYYQDAIFQETIEKFSKLSGKNFSNAQANHILAEFVKKSAFGQTLINEFNWLLTNDKSQRDLYIVADNKFPALLKARIDKMDGYICTGIENGQMFLKKYEGTQEGFIKLLEQGEIRDEKGAVIKYDMLQLPAAKSYAADVKPGSLLFYFMRGDVGINSKVVSDPAEALSYVFQPEKFAYSHEVVAFARSAISSSVAIESRKAGWDAKKFVENTIAQALSIAGKNDSSVIDSLAGRLRTQDGKVLDADGIKSDLFGRTGLDNSIIKGIFAEVSGDFEASKRHAERVNVSDRAVFSFLTNTNLFNVIHRIMESARSKSSYGIPDAGGVKEHLDRVAGKDADKVHNNIVLGAQKREKFAANRQGGQHGFDGNESGGNKGGLNLESGKPVAAVAKGVKEVAKEAAGEIAGDVVPGMLSGCVASVLRVLTAGLIKA